MAMKCAVKHKTPRQEGESCWGGSLFFVFIKAFEAVEGVGTA